MNTEQIVKRGRGRPKHSVSFANITLAELNARFGQDQILPVGRIFLEKGITPVKVQTVTPPPVAHPARTVDEPKVEMTLQA